MGDEPQMTQDSDWTPDGWDATAMQASAKALAEYLTGCARAHKEHKREMAALRAAGLDEQVVRGMERHHEQEAASCQ